MDEGQDTINAQQDVYETLSQIMPSIAPMLKLCGGTAAVSILIDSSSLSASAKKTGGCDTAAAGSDATASQADCAAGRGGQGWRDTIQDATELCQGAAGGRRRAIPRNCCRRSTLPRRWLTLPRPMRPRRTSRRWRTRRTPSRVLVPHIVAHDATMQRGGVGIDAYAGGEAGVGCTWSRKRSTEPA